jgi:transcriptional regulator with XRE-family HTH domain
VRQPSIETLAEIANVLDVDIRQLLNPTKEK